MDERQRTAVGFNLQPPPVVIESVKIDNIEQSAARSLQSAIEMQPNQNNLEKNSTEQQTLEVYLQAVF